MAHLSKLELQVHLIDGNINRFTQTDPEKIRQTLSHIQPERVFAQRQIILSTERALTVYPSSAVARLDLVMEGFPGWAFHHNVHSIEEISYSDFRERLASLENDKPRFAELNGSRRVYAEMELSNGERLYREVRLKPQPLGAEPDILGIDQSLFLQQIFTLPGLFCKRQGGGAIIVNSSHLLSMTFHPCPAVLPNNVWQLQSQALSARSSYALAGEMCG